MPSIRETVEIKADPEAVFDLIARVEDFSRYTAVIRDIRALGHDTYRWRVKVAGVPLEWDVEVTERRRPRRFAWRSIRGVANSGSYELEPVPGGTRASFAMEYRLPNPLLELLIAPLANPLIRTVSVEILAAVKARLESGAG